MATTTVLTASTSIRPNGPCYRRDSGGGDVGGGRRGRGGGVVVVVLLLLLLLEVVAHYWFFDSSMTNPTLLHLTLSGLTPPLLCSRVTQMRFVTQDGPSLPLTTPLGVKARAGKPNKAVNTATLVMSRSFSCRFICSRFTCRTYTDYAR